MVRQLNLFVHEVIKYNIAAILKSHLISSRFIRLEDSSVKFHLGQKYKILSMLIWRAILEICRWTFL